MHFEAEKVFETDLVAAAVLYSDYRVFSDFNRELLYFR